MEANVKASTPVITQATAQTLPYTLEQGDKTVQVMAYTNSSMVWGDLVVKDAVRVSTWLRTNNAPDRIRLYNARVVSSLPGNHAKPLSFSELHIASTKINIFHLIPPSKEPLDFDPTEPNRKMFPVTMLVSNFRIEGHLRLATQSSVGKFLEVVRENFTSIYDAQITNPLTPSFGTIQVPYVIVRQEETIFAIA